MPVAIVCTKEWCCTKEWNIHVTTNTVNPIASVRALDQPAGFTTPRALKISGVGFSGQRPSATRSFWNDDSKSGTRCG